MFVQRNGTETFATTVPPGISLQAPPDDHTLLESGHLFTGCLQGNFFALLLAIRDMEEKINTNNERRRLNNHTNIKITTLKLHPTCKSS
jgi:hypothetical protein